MNTQPTALCLADDLDQCHVGHIYEGPTIFSEAAAELRRLHEVNQKLLEALNRVLDEPNNTMSDGKALKEIIRIARATIAKTSGKQA